uniref:Uncharacterized protein LOC101209993 n=1 Tax=Rhizophora mucronata TaxID=61149 RepID=A0A2P2PQB9_RHIMU
MKGKILYCWNYIKKN